MVTHWDIEEAGSATYIQIHGNLDVESAAGLREQIRMLAPQSRGRQIVVNMREVSFMDSTGLAALILGLKVVRQNKGELVLMGINPSIMNIFRLTLLDRAFTFV